VTRLLPNKCSNETIQHIKQAYSVLIQCASYSTTYHKTGSCFFSLNTTGGKHKKVKFINILFIKIPQYLPFDLTAEFCSDKET